jgi:hypothetical protein
MHQFKSAYRIDPLLAENVIVIEPGDTLIWWFHYREYRG